MTASEVLRKARALIEKPENWTQGVEARNVHGEDVSVLSHEACRWSLIGAVRYVVCSGDSYDSELSRAARQALRKAGGMALLSDAYDFNDTHTHAEVLSLFDRAIAAAEARGE